ncbi:hypothetical protein ACH4YO_07240 [Streptomyces noursei]
MRTLLPEPPIADDYIGEATRIAEAAVHDWSATSALDLALATTPLSELAS